MLDLDSVVERFSRRLAGTVSRRSMLRGVGALLVGAASLPLLPVARGANSAGGSKQDPGDPASCDYWRYCAIDGFLCACCGGSVTVCPPGTEPAPITWVGTCRNAGDERDYIVSYNDCCGKASCGRCLCNRNEGDGPIYRPPVANDYNWCVGSKSNIPYHCTVSRIVGVADKAAG
jgi:methylamine dehydrogenase light chain